MTKTMQIMVRNLPPFVNPDDPVVSTVLGGLDQIFQQLDSVYNQEVQNLSIITASGSALDRIAQRFSIYRYPGETDANLIKRIAAIVLPRLTPNATAYQLQLYGLLPPNTEGQSLYAPGGNVLIGWNPSWAYNHDRVPITPTFTRNSPATGPDGTQEVAGVPTWYTASNGPTWFGVFQATTQLLTNTNFGTLTSGVPTGYTVSLLSGDTLTVGTAPASYPIQGDNVATWARNAAASSGTTTFTSPSVPVSPSTTYALSLYVNTSSLSGGSIQLQVVDGSTVTTLVSLGTYNGFYRLYGTYTTTSTSTSIALQLSFPYQLYGSVVFGSPQIEQALAPTEYLRNSTTSGTASRSAATCTLPQSVCPIWGQGTVGLALYVTPATQSQPSVLLSSPVISITWDGTNWNAVLGSSGTASAKGALTTGPHYLLSRWNNLLNTLELWIDGARIASTTISSYPSTGGSVYLGSNSSGSQQVNGYIGNVTICNAWLPDGAVAQWTYNVRTPIYAPTLFQGNFESENLQGTSGSVSFGTAFETFLPLTESNILLGQSPFVLDQSGMDSGFALQGIAASVNSSSALQSVLAAGVDVNPFQQNRLQ